MKKLSRRKGTVHPSPPLISDHLAFLPAAILTLAAALSPQDREVLAYLISHSSSSSSSSLNNQRNTNNTHKTKKTTISNSSGGDHPSSFNCNCFRCYTSYWVRWDESPSRQLIHEIIDAFEDGLAAQAKRDKNKRERRRGSKGSGALNRSESTRMSWDEDELGELESVEGSGGGGGEGEEEVDDQKGSVRKFVSFVGEKFWSTVWS